MKVKKIILLFYIILLVCLMTGCAYYNVSFVDVENRTENRINRKSSYWSGLQKGDRLEVKEGEKINFNIEMEKGSVTFILEDSEKNEVFTVTKEGTYSGSEIYVAEETDTLWLTEKGKGFKGKYEITWGKSEENNGDSEKKEED